MLLTLRQIHYFIEILDCGNMSRAAEQLHLAPTALSVQVKAMEDRLGVELLERHSRGVRATRAGAELYHRGRRILSMVDETERQVAGKPDSEVRRLRWGVPPSVLRIIGVEALLAGNKQPGEFVVQIVEGFSGDLAHRLERKDLDFVLASGIEPTPPMRTIELIEECLVFATPAGGAAPGPVSLAEAFASDLIVLGEDDTCYRAMRSAARAGGLTLNVLHEVGSIDVIRHMVARGLGTAIVPYGVVAEHARRGELVVHAISDRPIRRRLSLFWMEEESGALARHFLRYVMAVVEDLHDRTRPHTRLLTGHQLREEEALEAS
jgi:LysR family transcriptional regulator, nitrogen assimilation regulatory protein